MTILLSVQIRSNYRSQVLSHYVTVDIILIMANHQDAGVRTSIIRLLANICGRLSETVHNNSMKSFHWHHLANQISLHKADVNLVTSIVHWVTARGMTLSLDQLVNQILFRLFAANKKISQTISDRRTWCSNRGKMWNVFVDRCVAAMHSRSQFDEKCVHVHGKIVRQ